MRNTPRGGAGKPSLPTHLCLETQLDYPIDCCRLSGAPLCVAALTLSHSIHGPPILRNPPCRSILELSGPAPMPKTPTRPRKLQPPRDSASNGAPRSEQGFPAAEHRSIAQASAYFPEDLPFVPPVRVDVGRGARHCVGVVPGCHVSPTCTWGLTSSSQKTHNIQASLQVRGRSRHTIRCISTQSALRRGRGGFGRRRPGVWSSHRGSPERAMVEPCASDL